MNARTALWKRLGFVFISFTLTLAALGSSAAAPRVAHAAGPYVVDATLDAADFSALDHVCDDGVGDCTLRAAIQQATYEGVPATITFASDLIGQTFAVTDTLLWDGDNITVTGESKNITISGASLVGVNKSIFKIEGSHNLLENVTIRQAQLDGVDIGDFVGVGSGVASHNTLNNLTLLQNAGSGVYVSGRSDGGQFNTIQNSHIGFISSSVCGLGNGTGVFIDQGATSTTVNANDIVCSTANGVEVQNSDSVEVSGNHIGLGVSLGNGGNGVYGLGTTGLRFDGNIITSNASNGILLQNSSTTGVYGNVIGMGVSANAAYPNGGNGIALTGNSDHSTIGSVFPGANYISGNSLSGILFDGSGVHDNTVIGNKIGTNGSGTAAVANGENGVRLQNGAHNNTIGGHGSTDVRNIISGNGLDGILLQLAATQNYIDGNFIGLDTNGLTAIPNGLGGVAVISAPSNSIGGSFASTYQYISGNNWQGVYVANSDNTFILQSNRIGLAADNATARGNGQQGVYINESINSTIIPFAVLFNGGTGVALTGADSQNDKIAPTYVAYNGGLPIDLGGDGATANDPGDGDGGPNTLLNYPVITSYAGSVITGTVCANCTVLIYVGYGNPAASYGGGFEIQSATANGLGQWTASLVGGLHRFDVGLVACQSTCDLTSNTSEMSPRLQLFLPLTRR